MTFPVHNRLVVRGQLGDTKEVFSNVLHFPSDVSVGPDVLPEDWDTGAMETAIRSLYEDSLISGAVHVTGWRGYQIGADGRVKDGHKVVVDFTTRGSGGGLHKYPPQVALVITLVADNDGPAHFGRVFLPIPNRATLSTTLEMAPGDADSSLLVFRTYLNGLLDAMYPETVIGEGPCNVSKVGTGTLQRVTSLKCGLALDTIRTRRNKLLENYQELSMS